MNNLPFKGFILPDGRIIPPDSTLSHERMAFSYIREIGHYENFRNSEHSSAQDYLVYKLNAMQVRSGGEQVLILLLKNHSLFSPYIDEYKNMDCRWRVLLLTGE